MCQEWIYRCVTYQTIKGLCATFSCGYDRMYNNLNKYV